MNKAKHMMLLSLIAMLAVPIVANASDADLLARIEALEQENSMLKDRVYRLEQSVFGEEVSEMADAANAWLYGDNESADNESQDDNDNFTLDSGTYIVGEDIDAGTYSLTITSGDYGTVMIFKDYESFLNDNASILDALSYYNVGALENQFDLQSKIGSLKLMDGMCLYISGASGNMVKIR